MSVLNLRKEERLGLAIAAAAHIALIGVLAAHALRAPPQLPIPQRMTVSLAQDVGPVSTAPKPSTQAQAAVAPTLSEQPAPAPEPQQRIQPPRPTPVPIPPKPVAEPKPSPKPAPKHVSQPKPQPKPSPRPVEHQAAKPNPKPEPKPSVKPAGGSRIGEDFLKGSSAGDRSKVDGNFAAAFGPTEKASLRSAISCQLRPHWTAPQGVDVEKLVTLLDWDLNPDGSLSGRPRLRGQTGITDANRPQAARHAELAIRAVELAAPFNLPKQYYDQWKHIRNWSFDRNSSQ